MQAEYRNPRDIDEAVTILANEPTWRPVCGGTDLLVQRQLGRLTCGGFVNLWGLLPRHIESQDGEIRLGAGVTCAELNRSSLVAQRLPALHRAASTMGSPQIRNRATLGGNAGNASPAADMVAALMVDEARAVIRGPGGERELPLGLLVLGPGKTSLRPGEIIAELKVKAPPERSYCRFDKLGFRQAQVIAAVSFSIRATADQGGVGDVRITWGSVAPRPVRSHAVEGVLRGAALTRACASAAVEALAADIAPIDDHRASAAYRTAVARSFLERALKECETWLSS